MAGSNYRGRRADRRTPHARRAAVRADERADREPGWDDRVPYLPVEVPEPTHNTNTERE